MTAPTDLELVAELRGLRDLALPEMLLDGRAVRAAGRRRAHARRWGAAAVGASAAGVVAAAVLVVGVPRTEVATSALSPAVSPPAASPPAATPGTVSTLATGVTAVTEVVGIDDGGERWSTGLVLDDPAGAISFDLRSVNAVDLPALFERADIVVEHGLEVVPSRVLTDYPLAFGWGEDGRVPAPGERDNDPTSIGLFRREPDPSAPTRILAGVVPSWLPGARVVLFSASGMTDPRENRVHAVEVPTFADPAGSGARVYLVVTDYRVPPGSTPDGIVYVTPERFLVDADRLCGQDPEGCTGPRSDGLDVGSAVLSAVGW